MADADYDPVAAAELKKRRAFRKFSYRGVELDDLLELGSDDLRTLFHARARRRLSRGLRRKPMGLVRKLRVAKQNAAPNEKARIRSQSDIPAECKTHLRNMIVVPELIGSVVAVYNGKVFNSIEIRPEMVGHYLGEFSISYTPVKHGRPGIGATHSSRFIPLK
ncbi:ribosomal protein S15, eukaryotic/archaeal [Xylaria bambusicola]|uniref:ribosomal protein S15, eukaryotic/archaeal n=1 Tax=Xylaria bambusicola TaxID=326684 RepID=UPI0020072F76|nr:ribosomal protein S15, eukaryotic/archaeal [Xylaria bambusicola]KAI0505598.1 ribosomal protein S15, eukaryotic/archaeal [Xylaria bambusicola]